MKEQGEMSGEMVVNEASISKQRGSSIRGGGGEIDGVFSA